MVNLIENLQPSNKGGNSIHAKKPLKRRKNSGHRTDLIKSIQHQIHDDDLSFAKYERKNSNIKKIQMSPKKLLSRIYRTQHLSSKKRGHEPPSYTIEDLLNQYVNDPTYIRLYQNWINSGRNKWLAPSLDRIDISKGYSLENIVLMTWKENHERGSRSKQKPVRMLKDGKLIGEFESITEAGYESGCSVSCIAKLAKSGLVGKKGFSFEFISKEECK